nr:hypothetical protein B0A51_04938 [Rachicladosporium sp. CCFEE 5018]
MPALVTRQYNNNNNRYDPPPHTGELNCYYDAYGRTRCNSAWSNWARWLVLALIILFAFFIFFVFSCITARRRRKAGHMPYRGTGWTLGRTPAGHAPAQYNGAAPQYGNQQNQQPYYNNSNNPPPAYGQGANAGYYGNNNPIELQQPQQAYGGAYAPPKGPPPVVR